MKDNTKKIGRYPAKGKIRIPAEPGWELITTEGVRNPQVFREPIVFGDISRDGSRKGLVKDSGKLYEAIEGKNAYIAYKEQFAD